MPSLQKWPEAGQGVRGYEGKGMDGPAAGAGVPVRLRPPRRRAPGPALHRGAGRHRHFHLTCGEGYEVVGADCETARIRRGQDGTATLTLRDVRYSTAVSLTVEKSRVALYYDPNDGSGADLTRQLIAPSHLRWNTAGPIFSREGYTLTGWNTAPDSSGTRPVEPLVRSGAIPVGGGPGRRSSYRVPGGGGDRHRPCAAGRAARPCPRFGGVCGGGVPARYPA